MIRILAVDDEPLNLIVISECLSDDGYQLDEARDGEEAWEKMQQAQYDLIILDRMMPVLDGLSLLKRAKADPRWAKVPVIMQTAATSQQEVREGIEAGAYFYLTKPYEPEALRVLVGTIVADLEEQETLRKAGAQLQLMLDLMQNSQFHFRTLEQAHGMAAVLGNLCDNSGNVTLGLSELLVNAIEHGNLGISYGEKTQLRQNFQWEEEVARRLSQAPWAQKECLLECRRDGETIVFTIIDQGEGFDWQPYLDFDPVRAYDPNGRGIALATKMGFASISYQGKGNIVVARAPAKPQAA